MLTRLCAAIAMGAVVLFFATGCQDNPLSPDTPTELAYAKGGGGGHGGGGGGGGGGKGGGGGGGGKADKGDIYADLVFLLRDLNGEPILIEYAGEECVQPVSYTPVPGLTPTVNPVNGEDVWVIPLLGEEPPVVTAEEDEDELEVCDPQPQYLVYIHEVEIGRLNLTRSPDRVLDAAFREVLTKLRTWDPLFLDHAGRLATLGATMDAPRENLALYRDIMAPSGLLPALPTPPELPSYDGLHHAASALGAGADKFGEVNEDLVWYLNRILAMSTDFSAFSYTRSEMFPGCVHYWVISDGQAHAHQGTLMDEVFGGNDFTGANIHGFSHRANDTRAVILFEHDMVVDAIDRIGESAVCQTLGITPTG